MKRLRQFFHRTLVGVLLLSSAGAEEFTARAVTWGRTEFRLALPKALSGTNAARDAKIRLGIPANNDLIAAFYSSENWYYATMLGVRANRDVPVTQQDFIGERDALKAGMTDAVQLSKATAAVVESRLEEAREAGTLPQITLERPALLGVFDESDRHASCLILLGISETQDGAAHRSVVVISSSMLYVNNRIVALSIYHPFKGKETYAVIKELTKEIVRETLAANKRS